LNAALRLTVIVLLGYVIAVIATPFLVLSFQTVVAVANGGPPPSDWQDFPSFVVMGIMITGMYAAAPFLAAIGLMRYFRRRDWPTHGVAGVVVSYIALWLFTGNLVPLNLGQAPFLVTGFVVAVLYWLFRRPFGWSWL
jgi:amino acid transporter